jgi:alkylated DNA repair protein (DNA oxidative demethylase)
VSTEILPGVHLFQPYLDAPTQRALWEECRSLARGPVPMYVPTVRGGRPMSVGMLCLGRHWNARTYAYESRRTDFDDLPVPSIPPAFGAIAITAAGRAGYTLAPDICIINHYLEGSRMGVHQDKDERRETLEAGVPIVSLSVGDTARFVIGGLTRKEPTCPLMLHSGDLLVMGGPSRLRFHGVTRIIPGTAPPGTGPGRFNLTFRQW